jgi:predicted phage-related endonuclease
LEEPIAAEWAERNSYKIQRQSMRFSKEWPWMFVTIDRRVVSHPRGPGLVEVKNFSHWTGAKIYTLDDVPAHVRIQVQHGLAVTKYEWAAIVILVGGNRLLDFEVERDPAAIETIVEATRQFMDRLKQGLPPAVDAKAAEVLSRAYPKDDGTTRVATDEGVVRLASELIDWKAKCKEAEEEWEARKNAMKLLMGPTTCLKVPGVGEFTWKAGKGTTKTIFDEDRFRKEEPAHYAKYLVKVPSGGERVFRDKPDKAAADAVAA